MLFDRFELLERIRVGGMAEVYRARELANPDRLLAIKRILPSFTDEADYVAMFIDEARLGLRLSHRCIAAAYELGQVEDEYYIALEYVHGQDCGSMLRKTRERAQPLPVAVACHIVSEVCTALQFAHELRGDDGEKLGIVHRDVSPQNLLVSYDGDVKLIDFGIAKSTEQLMRTQAGLLKGKHGYLSPEQAQGQGVDPRSDVFSAGICLYEMLAAERLFYAASDFSTLVKVRNAEVPDLRARNPNVPPELSAIVQRALARLRRDRFQSAAELGEALDRFVAASGERCDRSALARYMRETFPEQQAGAGEDAEPQRDAGTGLLDAFEDVEPPSAVSSLIEAPASAFAARDLTPAEVEPELDERAEDDLLEDFAEEDVQPPVRAEAHLVDRGHHAREPSRAGEDLLAELQQDEPTRVVAYESTLSGELISPSANAPGATPERDARDAGAGDAAGTGELAAARHAVTLPGIGVDWDDDDLSTQIYDPPEDELEPMPAAAPLAAALPRSAPPVADAFPGVAYPGFAPRPPASMPPSGNPLPFAPASPPQRGSAPPVAPSSAQPPPPRTSQQLPRTGAAVWLVAGGLAIAAIVVPGTLLLTRAPEKGTMQLTTDPADAIVKLDGIREGGSTSPFVLSDLEPRINHEVEVSKPGYSTWTTRLTLSPGEELSLPHVQLTPEPAPAPAPAPATQVGALPAQRDARVETAPRLAPRPVEVAPVAGTQPAPGTAVAAPRPAPRPQPRPAPVAAPRPPAQRAKSLPSPSPDPGPEPAPDTEPESKSAAIDSSGGTTGVLRVNSRPWSQVFVDGRLVGNTPQLNLVLGAGLHTVTLVNPDFQLQRVLTVTLKKGETLTKIVDLAE